MSPTRAVLFDLDGTLLYSLADIAASMNAVLAQQGFPLHATDTYKRMIGEGVEQLVARAIPAGERSDEDLARLVAAMRAEYTRRWDDKSRLYAGVDELLDALAERDLPLAVLSNKPHDFTVRIVERFFSRWRWSAVAGAKADVPKKPDPHAALAIAAQLELDARAVLYVGDSAIDMQTAVAAGMRPCGVLWGYRERAELEAAGARAVVSEPHQILALL